MYPIPDLSAIFSYGFVARIPFRFFGRALKRKCFFPYEAPLFYRILPSTSFRVVLVPFFFFPFPKESGWTAGRFDVLPVFLSCLVDNEVGLLPPCSTFMTVRQSSQVISIFFPNGFPPKTASQSSEFFLPLL